MIAKTFSVGLKGIDGYIVEVEVDRRRGLPAFHIIGLTDKSIQESKERVTSAIKNSGFDFPKGKVLINLSPANLAKTGTGFDLAIAVAILKVSDQFPFDTENTIYWGELALDGSLRSTKGTLIAGITAKDMGFNRILFLR